MDGCFAPPDARRTWLIRLRLDLLVMIPGSCPTRLKVADATVLITILCWPDGWPHGADSVWQACDDALQCAQAAGSCPDDILVRLAAEAPRSGVYDAKLIKHQQGEGSGPHMWLCRCRICVDGGEDAKAW